MIERGGEVCIKMLANVQQATIKPRIEATIIPGTCVFTDEYDIYSRLEQWGYAHESVCHSRGEYAVMTMAMGFAKSMSTPWRGSGRCSDRGCVRIAVSRRPICRCTWAFSSSFITSDDVAKRG